jgi:hypothetical protein
LTWVWEAARLVAASAWSSRCPWVLGVCVRVDVALAGAVNVGVEAAVGLLVTVAVWV